MKIFVTFLITGFVLVSCKVDKIDKVDQADYASCEDYCNQSKVDDSNIKASVIMPGDIRCYAMRGDAHRLGKKRGYCFDGPLFIDGKEQPQTDPNPEACDALMDQAEEKCKKLPPDPSMMDQTVSGTTVFKDGKPILFNAKPVKIKGEVCSCNKKK